MNASLLFILGAVFLESLGFGIVFPLMPDLMRRYSENPEVIARYSGYFLSVFAASQFLSSPILGMLSDRFGRRPMLLLSLLGSVLDYAAMALAPTAVILLFTRMIAGILASGESVAEAYLVDISDDNNRVQNFARATAAGMLGTVLGPLIGGLLGGENTWFGVGTPFFAAAALMLLNLIYGWFVMPESLTPEKRRTIRWMELNPLSAFQKGIGKREIRKLLIIIAFFDFIMAVNGSVWALYTEKKFGWTPQEIGFSFAFVGISFMATLSLGSQYVIRKLGEMKTVHWSTLFMIGSFFLFAFSHQSWMLYLGIGILSIGMLVFPALQSIATRQVSQSEQGELSGILASVRHLMAIPGPIFFTYLFKTYPDWPGISYTAAGIIGLIGWTLFQSVKSRSVTDL